MLHPKKRVADGWISSAMAGVARKRTTMGDSTWPIESKPIRVSDRQRRTKYELILNAPVGRAGSICMSGSLILLVLVICQPFRSFAQIGSPADQSPVTGVPKPVASPISGTWTYSTRANVGGPKKLNSDGTYFTTVKNDNKVWTVTTAMQFPEGPVTDTWTLEKGTLILRKESFKHFTHEDQKWKPVAIDLDFTDNKVTGASTNANGQTKQVVLNLTGPISADGPGSMATIGCLPLAEGYAPTVRDWDVERLKESLWKLKVTGVERVTVPAGTFDSYKVAMSSTDGRGDEATVWIAKDSRMPVKISEVDKLYGHIETEMVPNVSTSSRRPSTHR
jgi:Protein of unknown function (DUF3108)